MIKEIYIDVRSPEEVSEYSIEDAINIDLQTLDGSVSSGKIPELLKGVPLETPLNTFCVSGMRAGIAVDLLKQFGFINVKNAGGIRGLKI